MFFRFLTSRSLLVALAVLTLTFNAQAESLSFGQQSPYQNFRGNPEAFQKFLKENVENNSSLTARQKEARRIDKELLKE